MPIRSTRNAASSLQSFLRRYVSPFEVAELSSCVGIWTPDPNYVTEAAGRLSALANIKAGGPAMLQATATNQPVLQVNSAIGHNVVYCDNVQNRFLQSEDAFDYAGAFTLVALIRPLVYDYDGFFGHVASSGEQSAITARAGGSGLQLKYQSDGTAATAAAAPANGWEQVIAFYDGTNELAIRANNGTIVTDTATTEQSASTALCIGNDVSAFSAYGEIALAAAFNADLRDDADGLALLEAMLEDQFDGVTALL